MVVPIVLRVWGQWRRLACWGKLGFLCWYVECSSVAHQVDGWILEESQMSLVVSCDPKDRKQWVPHLGLYAVRGYRVGHDSHLYI